MHNKKKQWVQALYFLLFVAGVYLTGLYLTSAPGGSAPAVATQGEDSIDVKRMKRHVTALAEIGERRAKVKGNLDRAHEYIERRMGHQVVEQEYMLNGLTYTNLEVEIPGEGLANEIVVIGAHYDTHRKSPGASDNASGCAVLLDLAQRLRHEAGPRTLRLVFFTLGEWPHLRTDNQGSRQWLMAAKRRGDNIVAMLSIDSVGVFYDHPGSQSYPPLLNFYYPSEGNFLGFLGNISSRDLVRTSTKLFRDARRMPAESLIAPGWGPSVSMSDHWSFWQEGIPAVLVTDTMGWRNQSHHDPLDTADGLDYGRMVLVAEGMVEVCRGLRLTPSL